MFSGIVEEKGKILSCHTRHSCLTLHIQAKKVLEKGGEGSSISVNGVCLTVVSLTTTDFHVQVVPETLRVTTLSQLKEGDFVNLESALIYGNPVGGHLVQGHVDCTAALSFIEKQGDAWTAFFKNPPLWSSCLIPKGFITIDGMSLTVSSLTEDHFGVSFVPHTIRTTIAGTYSPGQQVNVEVDSLTKTILTLLQKQKGLIS